MVGISAAAGSPTISNHEMIVPNSKLLEDKVTNLTLSDNLVRTVVAVTLSRTLPIDEARRRLLDAATMPAQVLAEPGARGPADRVSARPTCRSSCTSGSKSSNLMECRVVESKVRYSISKLLGDTDAESTSRKPAAPLPAVRLPAQPLPAPPPRAARLLQAPFPAVSFHRAHRPAAGRGRLGRLPARSTDNRDTRKAG